MSIVVKQFHYIVRDKVGIHARPAGLLVKEAAKYKSTIEIGKGEEKGNAKRIFSIMGMNICCGDEVTVYITGEDENEAFEGLQLFFQKNL